MFYFSRQQNKDFSVLRENYFEPGSSLVKYSLKGEDLEKLPFTSVLKVYFAITKRIKNKKGKWVFQEMMKLM